MSHRHVPAARIRPVAEHSRRAGALLVTVSTPATRQRLTAAITDAGQRQELTPGYAAELQVWSRHSSGYDGVPATSIAAPSPGLAGVSLLHRFPRGQLNQPQQLPGHEPADDAAELLVIAARTMIRSTGCAPARRPAPCRWPRPTSGWLLHR